MTEWVKRLQGYVKIRVWGFAPQRFINLCSNKGILLWNIEKQEDVYTMCIGLRSFYELRPIARKTKVRVVISERYGLPFFVPGMLRRKAFLAGLFLAVAFWLISSLFVWDIQVTGNYQVTDDVFYSFLEQEGIHTGMRRSELNIGELIGLETISLEAAQFLETLVKAGYNIFVSGGTGSGKTTFLNVLSGYISAEERVITIEDSAELQLQGLPNLVRLETRNGNTEGCREIGIRELIRSSLRMRPDRIIVGEVRGPEAIDMLQCMNTGHDGSMSTGHANSATDMLARLENMVLMGMDLPLTAIRNQIASGVDVIVHLGRIRDKSRRVLEITEVVGCENGEIRLNPLYQFEELGENSEGKVVGRLRRKGELLHEGKLKAAGLS